MSGSELIDDRNADALLVPEGWRLVPVELTQPMLDAGFEVEDTAHGGIDGWLHDAWDAMLAVAPAARPSLLSQVSANSANGNYNQLVEALAPFAALAAELFKPYETRPGEFREPYSDKADDEAVYAINSQPITYGDLRKARAALSNLANPSGDNKDDEDRSFAASIEAQALADDAFKTITSAIFDIDEEKFDQVLAAEESFEAFCEAYWNAAPTAPRWDMEEESQRVSVRRRMSAALEWLRSKRAPCASGKPQQEAHTGELIAVLKVFLASQSGQIEPVPANIPDDHYYQPFIGIKARHYRKCHKLLERAPSPPTQETK